MTQDEKHAVALMRYSTIAPLISGTKDDFQTLDDYYREATGKPYPPGRLPETLLCRFY